MLSESSRTELIQLVQATLRDTLTGNQTAQPSCTTPELQEKCGCFVTLKTQQHLRGCLGRFTSELPLYETVWLMTRQSATEDPRFVGNRLTAEDLNDITFDISILSPLRPCDDPNGIALGTHGIYVRSGNRSGCFLPQVATETGWSIDDFWGNCCAHKAGLPHDAWKDPAVECFSFTAEVLEGKAQ